MKKILTVPSECVYPTQDNVDGNLVVAKGDYIVKSEELKYMVIELLGCGTFGQVFRCVSNNGDEVAIKVVKSINKYFQYEMNEVRILRRIKDRNLTKYFVDLYDAFIYKQHLCIVLELLGRNMYDLSKMLRFQGFSYEFLKNILHQLVQSLVELHNQGIIHCDLKPENILLEDYFSCKVKIVDFGSSSTKALSSVFYIQSRFYRAPEVILGIPYSSGIDVWSLGCIAYELMVGEPLFPGSSNTDQILKIHSFYPSGLPLFMLEHGAQTHMYFDKENNFKINYSGHTLTQQMMKEKIYSKPGTRRQHDLLIDFISKAINPSYLERALPNMLMKHPIFDEEDIDYNSSMMPSRSNIHAYSDFKPDTRKMSMYDMGSLNNSQEFTDKRKGSLFDINFQNRYK